MIDLFESAMKGHWIDASAAAAQSITMKTGRYEDLNGTDIAIVAMARRLTRKHPV